MIDPIDLAELESINETGHEIGIRTIAGYARDVDIRDANILKRLPELGVDYAQGGSSAEPKPLTNLIPDSAML